VAGHSKWSKIKRKKAVDDQKRGQMFTKLIRELTVAAREGGGDPDFNPRLRLAVDTAKAGNMPQENIDRAIKRGTGELEGVTYEEIVYEGYAPGGAAIMVKALTDNRNRTASNVRAVFSRGGGNLGEAGSVAWMFESKAVVTVEEVSEEQAEEIALAAIDAGAEDFKVEDGVLEITGAPNGLEPIAAAVKEAGVEPAQATVTMLPNATVDLDSAHAGQTLRLLDNIEDLEDIQQVFTNANFTDEALEKYSSV
jgi:YebC/PmpR family DNA-binding regulatory protein